jgi:hypothetical protein
VIVAGILIAVVGFFGGVATLVLFIWAAIKDGQEDEALQRQLGIKRQTRLGP